MLLINFLIIKNKHYHLPAHNNTKDINRSDLVFFKLLHQVTHLMKFTCEFSGILSNSELVLEEAFNHPIKKNGTLHKIIP